MADITDVCNVLASIAAQPIYPNGTGQASIIGSDVAIYQGWPNPAQLDADLFAGKAHVSVFPMAHERNTTRYLQNWQTQTVNPNTFTLTQNGQQVTVGGAQPAQFYSQNLCVRVGGFDYVYSTQSGDTITSIATALATAIPGATNTGPAITVPSSANIQALRVGSTGAMIREVRRQERTVQLSIWASTPTARDAIAQAVDLVLATMNFINLPDLSAGRLIYKGSAVIDQFQKSNLYRRDLNYSVEFATTQTTTATQVTQGQTNLTTQDSAAGQVGSIKTIFS